VTPTPLPARGLYLVTREDPDTGRLLRDVAAALDGGAVVVQYRDKSADAARREAQAAALLALCRARGVPLIVNDDLALAERLGADGVHVGEDDAAVAVARARLGPRAIVGASCYDSLVCAAELAAHGASYLAFGSFFASPSKRTTRRATPGLLRDAARFGLPRVAIGGLNADNARVPIEAGAEFVAVISAVFDAADPRAAARAIAALFAAVPTS
jgi:thiamine-phosphate pyrophosphorylase